MNKLSVICLILAVALPTAAFSRGGGMGSHHSASRGGAFGASPAGTNSLGTALSSGGAGGSMKGPPLGTGNAAVDREDKRVAKVVHSICRGC